MDFSTSSTALLTNLAAVLREDDPTILLDDPDDLRLLAEASTKPEDLLDLDLEAPSPLPEEVPDKLPVLDLVVHLLSAPTSPDLNIDKADFLEADLTSLSLTLEEVPDTPLDEDDETNLES
jgi:hypothetical protein